MKKAAEEMRLAKGRAPSRREILGKVAGVAAGRGGAFTEAMGATSDIATAYFQAEAQKEIARQAVHQAAVGANRGIMHELDQPFLDYTAQVGTAKKPASLQVSLSILSAYMLGVIAEKAYNDGIDLKTGGKVSEFANNALQIRAPLTALSAEYKLGPSPQPGTEAGKDAALKAYQEKIRKFLGGDFSALFG